MFVIMWICWLIYCVYILSQMERFRETEMSKLRIEENRKHKEQLDDWINTQQMLYDERYAIYL